MRIGKLSFPPFLRAAFAPFGRKRDNGRLDPCKLLARDFPRLVCPASVASEREFSTLTNWAGKRHPESGNPLSLDGLSG